MAKGFSTMQTNCGNFVMDTSGELATLIGVWINDKYKDISRRANWGALIVNDYTQDTTVGIASYDLPADFQDEIFVADIQDGRMLKRDTIGNWWRGRYGAYQADSISNGTPSRYYIDRENSKIVLDPPPDAVHTYAIPYKKIITDLATTVAPAIQDIEFIIEFGAIAEAWAYKKEFTRADYYNQKYEEALAKRIGQENKKYNQLYQMIPGSAYGIGNIYLTGEQSYNDL